jgi:N-glycosylase/DNA lyase
MNWQKLPLESSQLNLTTVLRCGQSFRWKQIHNIWSIAYKRRIIFVKQEGDFLYYRAEGAKQDVPTTIDVIHDYFNLDTDLNMLMTEWKSKDSKFVKSARSVQGVRILRQDPWECLCSFICSTNNNIKRISQMVENLCRYYGEFLGTVDGYDYYDFPGPEKLSGATVEAKLRSIGFGYRAKYIQKTAEMVSGHPEGLEYLISLREKPYVESHAALLEFAGVGPKVADCVCLMSLDKHDVIPVDTHVWQIAQRDYKLGRNFKTLNKVAYQQIGDHFRQLWGTHAGWAHSVLFTADLKDLNNGLNMSTVKTETKRTMEELEMPEPKKVLVGG